LRQSRERGDQLARGAFALGEYVEQRAPVRFGDRFEDVHEVSMPSYLYRCKYI